MYIAAGGFFCVYNLNGKLKCLIWKVENFELNFFFIEMIKRNVVDLKILKIRLCRYCLLVSHKHALHCNCSP